MSRPLRALYFGSHDRGPGRNTLVQEALRRAGWSVVEHHAAVWPGTDAKLQAVTPHGAASAAVRQAKAWRRLARDPDEACDVIIVGATAHLDLPLARRLARRRGVPVVFDPLVSVAETVRDRRLVTHRPLGILLRRAEARLFRLADRVLVDTPAHAAAWAADLGVDPGRMVVVHAGAPDAYRGVPDYAPRPDGPLRVAYFGQYIPLHGLETVLEAAALVRDEGMEFTLSGRGQTLPEVRAAAAGLGLRNVAFDERWLPADQLAQEVVARADVCLGVFGDQPKAAVVVPFKVYAALAAGRPVVTGDTPGVRDLLAVGREVAAVPVAQPGALARALRQLADDPGERERLADAGRRAYDARFSLTVLGRRVAGALEALVREEEPAAPRVGQPRWA